MQTSQDMAIPQPELRLRLLPPGSATSDIANAVQASPNNPRAAENIVEVSLAASIPPPAPIPAVSVKPHIARSPGKAQPLPLPQPPLKSLRIIAVEKSRDESFSVPLPAEGASEGANTDIKVETKNIVQQVSRGIPELMPKDEVAVQPPDAAKPEIDKQTALAQARQAETEEKSRQQAIQEAQRVADALAQQKAAEEQAARLQQEALAEEARKQTALAAKRLAEAQAEQQRIAEQQAAEAKAVQAVQAAQAARQRQEALEAEARKQAALAAKHLAEAQAEQQRISEQQAAEVKAVQAAQAQAARLRQEALEVEARKQAALTAKRLAEAQAEQQRVAEQQAAEAKAVQAAQAQAARLQQEALAEEARKQAALAAKRLAEAQAEQQRITEQQAAEAKAAQARQQAAQEAKRLADSQASELAARQARDSNNKGQSIASVATGVGDAHQPMVTNNGAAGNNSGQGSGKSSAGATQSTDAKSENKGIAVQTRGLLPDDSCSQKQAGRHFQVNLYATVWRHMVRLKAPYYFLDDAKTRPHINPIVTVTIRNDGNVENIVFNRSSGRPEIDNAIWRMIHFVAPYAVFPKDLAIECEAIEFPSIWSINNGLNVTWGGQ